MYKYNPKYKFNSGRGNIYSILASLYLVMLSFFILLNSLSKIDQDKLSNIQNYINNNTKTGSAILDIKNSNSLINNKLLHNNNSSNLISYLKKQSFFKKNENFIKIISNQNAVIIEIPINIVFQKDTNEMVYSSKVFIADAFKYIKNYKDEKPKEINFIMSYLEANKNKNRELLAERIIYLNDNFAKKEFEKINIGYEKSYKNIVKIELQYEY